MAITRKDVAIRAGVSEATVSYVVNNGPRGVAPETRARILQAIKELDYHPSDIARSLRKQSSSTLGLIVPDTANPFYGELARVIETIGFANGYTVVLCNSNFDPAREADYVSLMQSKRAEGVIIIPVDMNNMNTLLDSNIQIVVLEHEIGNVDCVVIDDFAGGKMVTEHLLKLNHRRIACIVRMGDKSTSRKRVEGYKSVLMDAGLPVDPSLIIEVGPRISDGASATFSLLAQPNPPTAIFAHSDTTALGVLSAIQELGLRVPDDISVVGYDDIEQAAFLTPPLTTVAYPIYRMGQIAAQQLLERIQEKTRQPLQPQILEVRLMVRKSTGPAPLIASKGLPA